MKTTKTIVVEQEVTTWKCDFCDFETDYNKGCCGTAPIMQCNFCGKDACRKHRESFWENEWEDYPNFTICQNCIDIANKCQFIAREIAGRYDIWYEVIKKIYENFEEYEYILEEYDYSPPKDIEPVNIEKLYMENNNEEN